MKKTVALLLLFLVTSTFFPFPAAASDEGTRHITGEAADLYFMNDKVFGTIAGHPLWAIYTCGTAIAGEIDKRGTYHTFNMEYQQDGPHISTGTFGETTIGLHRIERKEDRFLYHVFVGEQQFVFSIRYESVEDNHMVNSVIEGGLGNNETIRLTADGRLCPFATSGIVLLIAGTLVN